MTRRLWELPCMAKKMKWSSTVVLFYYQEFFMSSSFVNSTLEPMTGTSAGEGAPLNVTRQLRLDCQWDWRDSEGIEKNRLFQKIKNCHYYWLSIYDSVIYCVMIRLPWLGKQNFHCQWLKGGRKKIGYAWGIRRLLGSRIFVKDSILNNAPSSWSVPK